MTMQRLKRTAKQGLFATCRYSGLNAVGRWLGRQRLLILGYHGITSEEHPGEVYRCRNAVSLARFRRQLDWIGRRFHPISADTLLEVLAEGSSLPAFSILLTFDDGYRNNFTLAAPELEKRGIPAVFAVTTACIGGTDLLWTLEVDERVLQWPDVEIELPDSGMRVEVPSSRSDRIRLASRIRATCKNQEPGKRADYLSYPRRGPLHLEDWQKELYDFMDWKEVRDLHRRGFSIASHTVTHPVLSTLSGEPLRSELLESKSTIENQLQASCPLLVYPNGEVGDFNSEVMSQAEQVGYQAAFSLMNRSYNKPPLVSKPYQLDRVCIRGPLLDDVLAFRMSGLRVFVPS